MITEVLANWWLFSAALLMVIYSVPLTGSYWVFCGVMLLYIGIVYGACLCFGAVARIPATAVQLCQLNFNIQVFFIGMIVTVDELPPVISWVEQICFMKY